MDSVNRIGSNLASNVACLNCREKHLKCDGNPEGCSRCRSSSLFCHFFPSRRGRRVRPNDFLPIDTSCVPDIDGSDFLTEGSLPPLTSSDLSSINLIDPLQENLLPPINIHLVQIFYEYFHPAVPILPPLDIWAASSPPHFIIKVVELIGLHYLSPGQAPDLPSGLLTAIEEAETSLEKIQTYLLLSVLFHARKVPDYAKQCNALAIQYSFRLGLHCRETSDAMEMQSPARAESMRRTLWEIFIVDTLLAAVQVGGTLQFNMETPDVLFPTEDFEFEKEDYTNSSFSVQDLPRRLFSEDDRMSSYAYRIEATLTLRQCFIACETHACENSIEMLDTLISAWFHRWPIENSTILRPDGGVNQLDFQTAMIMHCASIYLHFQKSTLISYLPTTREILCSRPPRLAAPSANRQMHTAKIINAATELSKLSSLTTSVTGHSPFFACTLVLSSIVQLAALSAHIGDSPSKYYSYLALNIGVLKTMGGVWSIASSSMGKLREITREIEKASTESTGQLAASMQSFTDLSQ